MLLQILIVFFGITRGTLATKRLFMVHTVWSHGSHTPVHQLPELTQLMGEHPWKQGLGALTMKGKRELFNLGASLYVRYMRDLRFLNDSRTDQLHVQSTDSQLALTSAYAVMAGMVRENISRRHDLDNWRPFPVHTDPNDHMLRWNSYCPEAETASRFRLFSAPWFMNEHNVHFLRDSVKRSGMGELKDFGQLYILADILQSLKETKDNWPRWVDEDVFRKLNELVDAGAAISYSDHTVARLRGGALLGDILNRIGTCVKCDQRQETKEHCAAVENIKFYAYSTDDLTLHALSSALGAAQSHRPEAASAIVIETWKLLDGRFQIRALTKSRHDEKLFKQLLIGDCPTVECPLPIFQRRSQPYTPSNWRMECRLDQMNNGKRKLKGDSGISCGAEVDRSSSRNCYDWAAANYCNSDNAVRFIFCRYTCLCHPKFH